MKKIILALPLLLGGCFGDSSKDNTLIGQVKKTHHTTPLLCMDYDDADISLGVMRNGVGSMSTGDMWVYIPNPEDMKLMTQAAETGALVKVTFDTARIHWCVEEETVTHVELVK